MTGEPLRIGSLCTGYGGLDIAVSSHYGARVEWLAEFDAAASKVAAARHPGITNHGDITQIDWASLPPVDIITAGYPCQPFSHAGNRKGTTDERHIWPYIANAVRIFRPRFLIMENVAGHLSLGFDAVLSDLAAMGRNARWGIVRASDAGAPHQRARLFIYSETTDADSLNGRPGQTQTGTARRPGFANGNMGFDGRIALLPTPVVNDMGAGKTVDQWDAWTAAMQQKHGNGNGHGKSLAIEARRGEFKHYAAAVSRWETVIGRPAPPAALNDRLNPVFVEWLMGLPAGWVTDPALGISLTQQLKMLGNGVVPPQAALALEMLAP
jgi:DNA (cytosine-5)-methyltransferase 1